MANFDADSLRILKKIEDEFRKQYRIICNSRRINWPAVNRTRMLGDFMYMLGVPKWAVNRHDIVFVCASAKDALEMKYAVTAFVAGLNVGILIRD